MKLSFVALLLMAAGLVVYAQQPSPRMTSTEPDTGKTGDVIAVNGENLQKEQIAKVYLTDGKNDILVEVTEQTATVLKFKIPAKVEAGRLSVMVLTTGKEPKLLVQPVKITIADK
jgi:siroheme synthase (precorrin-2 oxidase/ferrochelatase)